MKIKQNRIERTELMDNDPPKTDNTQYNPFEGAHDFVEVPPKADQGQPPNPLEILYITYAANQGEYGFGGWLERAMTWAWQTLDYYDPQRAEQLRREHEQAVQAREEKYGKSTYKVGPRGELLGVAERKRARQPKKKEKQDL